MALALSRRRGEAIKIGENIIITVGETRGSHTVILIDAPKEIPVARIEGNTDGNGASPSKRAGRRRSGKVLHRLPAAARGNRAVAGAETGASGGGGAPTADAEQCRSCGAAADCQPD